MLDRQKCLTLNWDEITKFNDEFFPGWRNVDEIYYSNALAGEVGEVCGATKHRANGGTKHKEISDKDLLEELADCFIYIEMLVEKHNYDITDLSQAVSSKLEKNRQRMKERDNKYNKGAKI